MLYQILNFIEIDTFSGFSDMGGSINSDMGEFSNGCVKDGVYVIYFWGMAGRVLLRHGIAISNWGRHQRSGWSQVSFGGQVSAGVARELLSGSSASLLSFPIILLNKMSSNCLAASMWKLEDIRWERSENAKSKFEKSRTTKRWPLYSSSSSCHKPTIPLHRSSYHLSGPSPLLWVWSIIQSRKITFFFPPNIYIYIGRY